jgi:hypothetical protein
MTLARLTHAICCLAIGMSSINSFGQIDHALVYQASEAYESGDFKSADSLYTVALESASGDELALYNRGVVRFESSRYEEAIPDFLAAAESFGEDTLKSNAYHNLGNAHIKGWYQKDFTLDVLKAQIEELGQTDGANVDVKMINYLKKDSLLQIQKKVLSDKKAHLKDGIEAYKDALRVSPANANARYNLVYAMNLLPKKPDPSDNDDEDQDKPEPTEYAKKLKQQALDLVRTHEFEKAYKLLEEGTKKDETVQQFEELIKNLKIIVDIENEL